MDKEKFLVDLAEILEEETVKESDVLADFEAWDSLSILSISALRALSILETSSLDKKGSLLFVGANFTLISSFFCESVSCVWACSALAACAKHKHGIKTKLKKILRKK